MATSSYDSTHVLGCTTFSIPAGLTNAIFCGLQPYLQSAQIDRLSGGSLVIIPSNYAGATLAGATLAAATGHFINQAAGVVINGPATYYLGSLGATSVVQVLSTYSQGASLNPVA